MNFSKSLLAKIYSWASLLRSRFVRYADIKVLSCHKQNKHKDREREDFSYPFPIYKALKHDDIRNHYYRKSIGEKVGEKQS